MGQVTKLCNALGAVAPVPITERLNDRIEAAKRLQEPGGLQEYENPLRWRLDAALRGDYESYEMEHAECETSAWELAKVGEYKRSVFESTFSGHVPANGTFALHPVCALGFTVTVCLDVSWVADERARATRDALNDETMRSALAAVRAATFDLVDGGGDRHGGTGQSSSSPLAQEVIEHEAWCSTEFPFAEPDACYSKALRIRGAGDAVDVAGSSQRHLRRRCDALPNCTGRGNNQ